jgi:hypothetical protein
MTSITVATGLATKQRSAEYKKAFALCGYVTGKGLVLSAVQTGVA